MTANGNGVSVAVVGAGAVGELMLRVLQERHFPARGVKVLARTARTLTVGGRDYAVTPATDEAFEGVDIALFAGTEGDKGAAATFADAAIRRGAVVIDNGADFRMRPDVPLVVPEVNGETLLHHHGLIANPNCSTAQLVMALKPLHDAAHVTRVTVSTYQAVSGAGGAAVGELEAQARAAETGGVLEARVFPVPIYGNVIPQIGGFDENFYTSEEMKLVRETRKILNAPDLRVTPLIAARVPVMVGHCEAVSVEMERPMTPAQAKALWSEFTNVEVVDSPEYGDDPDDAWPTPRRAAGSDVTYIGRVRQDLSDPRSLLFWVVSDNLRKGAATNAVQIAEAVVARGLYPARQKALQGASA